ncbi:hypothetical protein DRP53_02340 [candidate division WOR-3 bacterium]|uniref:Uncharacterized protein n=1 Tax=candidate division WOR-3 bacterium TaxID=2052148 RepID=A0A660SK34_UNCW3|nr:MAG: hypothetical protein DRP53_02340 [candidate division WOR-3 bacterium]
MRLVLATLLVLSSFPLVAGGKEEVLSEIEKTDRWITRTQEVVQKVFDHGTQINRAERLLDFAQNLQTQARARYNLRHYKEALKLTLAARQAARRALELALGFEVTPQNVKRAIDRTDELITKVTTLIQKSKYQKVKDLYRIGLDTQKAAKESYRDQHLLVALKLTLSARRMVMRLIRMAQEVNSEEVRRELKITDRLITRVESKNPRIDDARRLQQTAYDHFNNGHYLEAYRLTKQAQRLIYSILKEQGKIDPEEVKRSIEETEHLLALTDLSTSTRSQISELIGAARLLYEKGEYRQALIKISVAKRLLEKAIEE